MKQTDFSKMIAFTKTRRVSMELGWVVVVVFVSSEENKCRCLFSYMHVSKFIDLCLMVLVRKILQIDLGGRLPRYKAQWTTDHKSGDLDEPIGCGHFL